jgi:hypothetical protein
VRIVLFIAARRARNRILDAVGWLLGYCMATTWRDETDDHGPQHAGYAHWRCWVPRRVHRATHGPNVWHRFESYRWRTAGPVEFAPLRDPATGRPQTGTRPAWSRRWPHTLTPTRQQARLVMEYAERQAAAGRARRFAAARAGRPPIMCQHGVAQASCPICSTPRPRAGFDRAAEPSAIDAIVAAWNRGDLDEHARLVTEAGHPEWALPEQRKDEPR